MAHLADWCSSSNCSLSADEQLQENGTFTGNTFDMNILADKQSVPNAPAEPPEAVFEDRNCDLSELIDPSIFTDFPDLNLTDLTRLLAGPYPIELQVAASYPKYSLQDVTYPLSPQGSVTAPRRQTLIPATRHPPRPQPHRYARPLPRISQAQHNWNLLESALGVIPCARRLPAGINPSFLRRPIPYHQLVSVDSNQLVMHFPNYPSKTKPPPQKLSRHRICHSYPNYLDGEILLGVVNSPPRWNAETVCNLCRTDGRHASNAHPYLCFEHRVRGAEEEAAVRQEVDALYPGRDGDARHN